MGTTGSQHLQPLALQGGRIVPPLLATAHLSEEAIDYREIDYRKPTAIVLGAELDGISADALAAVDGTFQVPLPGMVDSPNVSVATAIALYQALDQRQAAGMYDQRRISDVEFKRLHFEWLHPQVAQYCQRKGIAYPATDDSGDIVESPTGNLRSGFAAIDSPD